MEKLIELVRNFADRVKEYTHSATEQARTNALVRALQGVQRELTAAGQSDLNVSGKDIVTGTDLDFAISALQAQSEDLSQARQSITKDAILVQGMIDNDLLEGDASDIAAQAMTLWGEVSKSGKAAKAS